MRDDPRSTARARPPPCFTPLPIAAGYIRPGTSLQRHLHADAYAEFNDLYHPGRQPGDIKEASCLSHGRHKLFTLADVSKDPLAAEALAYRSDLRCRARTERHERSRPPGWASADCSTAGLWARARMRGERGRPLQHSEVARDMDYTLKRCAAFSQFVDDDR